MNVTIGIPSWNGREHLETCLAAIARQDDPGVPWDVMVFDNGSVDSTREWLAQAHPRVRVVRSASNVGFAAACNGMAEATDADLLIFLNNDTRPVAHWLAALVETMASAPPDVLAVSGKIVDWSGTRLDFAGGIMTFDGHAFQQDLGRPLDRAHVPASGAELPFPCGGNMIVRRQGFLDAGGFDAEYFAYLEDVDFGWRLCAAGHRVIFAADAVVHHRSSATSDRLGNARRGFLFERNAYLTAYKNYDAELWPQIAPAVLLTLIARTHALQADEPRGWNADGDAPSAGASSAGRTGGRGVRSWIADVLAARTVRGESAQRLALSEAIGRILKGLDGHAAKRRAIQARRRRSDRDIFTAFPLHVVPTYPGDRELFDSPAFRTWLPEGLPVLRRELTDIMER
jgi:GT2 family glycosyltransferase